MRQSCGVSYSQFTLPEETTVSSCCAEIDCRNDNQAELWMELLTPDDGTRTLLRYQHPAWGEYAAATEADYGQGRALYVGFLPQKGLISQLFDVLTADLTLNSRTSAYRYPLVVKRCVTAPEIISTSCSITPAGDGCCQRDHGYRAAERGDSIRRPAVAPQGTGIYYHQLTTRRRSGGRENGTGYQ